MVPLLQPSLPELSVVKPLLESIDKSCSYTNHGPIEHQLREALAEKFNRTSSDEVALFSSGTSAMQACIRTWQLPPGERCLVPSWTFVATAAAIATSGLEPCFIDVDAVTWTPTPETLEQSIDKFSAKAAVIVSPFGGSLDYKALCDLAERKNIKILIDAAASHHWVETICLQRMPLKLPIMMSLHATKSISSIEGGTILYDDIDAVSQMIGISNFGIYNLKPVNHIGFNGKLSEFHSAYGLQSLKQWPQHKARMLHLVTEYLNMLRSANVPCTFAPNLLENLASSTFNIQTTISAPAIVEMLKSKGIQAKRWWKDGVHAFEAYQAFPSDNLQVTKNLAKHVIGLPLFHCISEEQQETVVDCLKNELAGN